MKKIVSVFALFFMLISTSFCSTEIIYSKPSSRFDSRSDYYIKLLELALEESKDEFGDYDLVPFQSKLFEWEIVQSRILTYIKEDRGIDVHWTMTSEDREKELLAIRIPLLRGLLGHRIFIIKKGNEWKFKNIDSIEDLSRLKAGQGHDWPDTEILKSNHLDVMTAPKYESLFSMLEMGRYDYFPRGINEPWSEIATYGDGNLVVEKNILIQYPAPIYYFVNKENKDLAERIEYGLNQLIDNGKFDEYFYNHITIKEMFEQGNLPNRRIFRIENPLLTPESKAILNQRKYWYMQGDEERFYNGD